MLSLLIPLFLVAQESSKEVISKETIASEQTIYREIAGLGLGRIAFRDFATSPLIYKGLGLSLGGGRRKTDEKKEVYFSIRGLFGITTILVDGTTNNSMLFTFNTRYKRLYTLQNLSTNNWTYKVGGTIDLLTVARFNSSLNNNSIGLEGFPTIFGSFKVNKNFTRPPFLRKRKPAKRQSLSLAVDIGLVNTAFRNGYAYTFHAPFYNSLNLFKDHNFSWFAGFRVRTALAYTLYSNKNKNGIRFSYIWEGVRSAKTPDRFSLTTGMFQYTLLHRLN